MKKISLEQLESIKIILIGIVAMLIIIFSIQATDKIIELEKKIDNIKLLNNMLYQDIEQKIEYQNSIK